MKQSQQSKPRKMQPPPVPPTEKLSYSVGRQIGYLWPEEIDALKKLAVSPLLVPDPLVVVIGAGSGTFDLTIAEERPDARFVSVDILDCVAERGNMDLAGFGGRLTQIVGDSKMMGRKFHHPIDFLFIDGDHSYQAVQADIQVWLPKVKVGGLVGFHDYREDFFPGVVQAVDEYMGDYELVMFAKTIKVFRKVGE